MIKITKGKAVLMILLVLSLPLYSASVFASLSGPSVKGSDNLEGILRPNEDPQITVLATIPGDTITTNQITIGDLINGPFFDNCTDQGNDQFLCSLTAPATSITSNPFSIPVKLHNNDLSLDSQININGVVDQIPPQNNQFQIFPTQTKGGNVNIVYSIRDFTNDLAVTNKCSGIKQLDFASPQAGIFRSLQVNGTPLDCLEEGQIQIPIETLAPQQDGNISIILTAKDNVDNEAIYEATIIYDKTPPSITPTSLKLENQQGDNLDFLSSAPVSADITFTIASKDLDTSTVRADITSLHTNPPTGYDNKQATCQLKNDEFECTIQNVQVKIDASKTVSVSVTALDLLGNSKTEILNLDLQHDNTGPAINTLRTNFFDPNEQRNYGGTNFNITLTFLEIGAGIEDNNLRLDLSNIQSGRSNSPPDTCSAIASGNERACTWSNIKPNINDGIRTVFVLSSITDKLGNPVQGPLVHNITLDKTNPSILSAGIAPKGAGNVDPFPSVLKTGDAFIVTAEIREANNIISATADLSAISATQGVVNGICTLAQDDPGKKVCSFSGNPIDVPGFIANVLPLTFIDSAGNTQIANLEVNVLENKNFTGIRHWVPEVECSPDLIDRQLGPQININAYCKIDLVPTTVDQETLKLTFLRDQCTTVTDTTRFSRSEFGEDTEETAEQTSLDFVEDLELLNAGPDSTQPFLKVTLAKDDLKIDSIKFACPIEIFSRIGDSVTQEPELVNVTVELFFHNSPLSTFGEEIKKEIDDAKKIAENMGFKVIGFLKKIVKYATILCNAVATAKKIQTIYRVFATKMTLAHVAAAGTPLDPIYGQIQLQACLGDESMKKVVEDQYFGKLDPYCKIINCQLSPNTPSSPQNKEGKVGKTRSFLENWQTKGNKVLGGFTQGGGVVKEVGTLGLAHLGQGKSQIGGEGTIEDVTGKQPYQYMNAKDNLLVALTL
ncbi:MAG: hypothetical protein O2779_04650, partial [Nanoarchaeota archaeon]|nr:hypothetical protein [Nanoarchaeota archaeon]